MQLKSIWVRDLSLKVLSSSVTVQEPTTWTFFPKVVHFRTFLPVQEGSSRKISQSQAQKDWNTAAVTAFCKFRLWERHWRKSENSAYNTIYRRKLEHQHNSNKKLFSFSKTKHNPYKNNSNGLFSAMVRQNFIF